MFVIMNHELYKIEPTLINLWHSLESWASASICRIEAEYLTVFE